MTCPSILALSSPLGPPAGTTSLEQGQRCDAWVLGRMLGSATQYSVSLDGSPHVELTQKGSSTERPSTAPGGGHPNPNFDSHV